jgi:hypothetical protein
MHGIHPRLLAAVATTLVALPAAAAEADVWGTQFEAPSYALGDINGKADWQKAGPYDANVVALSAYPHASGFGFGGKALQISNFTTSGSFGDQTFTPSVTDEAGQADAVSAGLSGGDRQSRFLASWRIGVADPTDPAASDRHVTFSADRGDGARMTYLRFEDHTDGIHVFFDDVPSPAVDGGGSVTFDEVDIATLSRTQSHLVESTTDLVDGEDNDVVTVAIDGTPVHTGTTWENYFKHDVEAAGSGNKVPTVDSLLLREGGTANAGQQGKGFLVDDVRLESTSPGAGQGPAGPQGVAGAQGAAGASTPAALHEASPVVIRTKSGRVDRRGRVSVRLTCPQGAGLCDGSLVLTLGRSQAGRSAFDIDGGKSKTVKVKLSRSALKALGKKKRTFRVNVLARDIQGAAARSAGNLSVRKL